ncbi:MAG: hypothetical protein PHI85_04945 [Victivallaceae bacterium]|nr:hypothetical protein [Victivallaceae bacterium]
MAGTTLNQATIDGLIAKMQMYKYVCSVGETIIGPLKSAPKIEADVETKDFTIYEAGSEAQASILVKNNVKLTIEPEDVDAAVALLAAFAKGDNVIATASSKSITLVPVTDDAGAKTITFGNAFLQPGLSITLEDGDDPNSVQLVYVCRPVAATGKPFTYA